MQKAKVSALILIVSLFAISSCQTQKTSFVPYEKDTGAYLLVYFKDNTHSLHFALSPDGIYRKVAMKFLPKENRLVLPH